MHYYHYIYSSGMVALGVLVIFLVSRLRAERRLWAERFSEEKRLRSLVRDAFVLDDRIFHLHQNGTILSQTPGTQILLGRRIEVHEMMCEMLGFHPLREEQYIFLIKGERISRK